MTEDHELLGQYVREGLRPALDELIRRHISLVYSAALRQVGDPHQAEDVTQAVFMVLAQKARTIRQGVALGGWLLSVSRRASVNAMRKQATRKRHEKLAAKPERAAANPIVEEWNEIAPLLDAELNRLPRKDRDAIVLRFFQERTFAQVGDELGLSEGAARKRVERALGRLRGLLSRRGVLISAAALGIAITGRAARAAPIHVLESATAAIGAPPAASAEIAKGTIHMMAWAKAKLIGSIAAALFLAGAAVAAQSALAQSSATKPEGSDELIAQFQAEYPAAEAKLEEAYSHVRIEAQNSGFLQSGKVVETENVEYLREGNSVRGERTVLESNQANWPKGSFKAFGGDSDLFFNAVRLAGQTQFTMDQNGPYANFDSYVHAECLALYAPYCIHDQRLSEYLQEWKRKVVGAHQTTLDGNDAVEIVVDAMTPDWRIHRDHFYFQPHTWALEGWRLDLNERSGPVGDWQARITYEPNTDPPRVQTVLNWTELTSAAGTTRKQFRRTDVFRVEFGPIAAKEFTLAAIGAAVPPTGTVIGPRPAVDSGAIPTRPEAGLPSTNDD